MVAACGQTGPDVSPARLEPEAVAETGFAWPAGLPVLGDGFPKSGDPCRRLGESAETVNYLDDSAILVGCPGSSEEPASAALVTSYSAKVVGAVQNVTLLSIPQGDANVGMDPAKAP
jgi:hypothetical protein